MRIKFLFRAFTAALILAVSSVAAYAQVASLSGKVLMRQPDGTETPVQNAQVDIYRTDIKGEWRLKTDKKGVYQHAGLPFVGTYTIIVSAPGARPAFEQKVRVSQRPEIHFILEPGDGSRPTLDQLSSMAAAPAARAAASSASAPSESAEDKAKREEMERKIKEIESRNQKITQANEIVGRTFKAGNEFLNAKNYDAAIAQYNEGLAARDEAALYANKAVALRLRGADKYNAAIKSNDEEGKKAAYSDWRESAEAGKKAIETINAQTPPAEPSGKAGFDQNRLAAYAAHAEALKLVAIKDDKSRADEAFKVYSEYAALEADPAKKSQKQVEAAKILFDANAFGRAVEEFKKILETDPENAEANLYLGFALFNTGEKDKYQEAANYLGKFSEKAPETHPLKADAKSILDFLKTQENIKPEKVQPSRTTGRRRG